MSTPVTALASAPFTAKVANAMRSLYPEELADRAWDNVGLLLDNINRPREPERHTVLVTNDLTLRVAEEAIARKASVIVSYHPFIFRGFKAVTLNDPHQKILLQLAQNNIAVYCPHTAVDAAPGGMNDWLADMLDGLSTKRSTVQPVDTPTGFVGAGAGYGRVVELKEATDLRHIVGRFARGLGRRNLMVARPDHSPEAVNMVKSVALCPGSGFDVLKDTSADVIVTGEVTHHNALKATMEGRCIVTVFHSNSERIFLRERMRPQLENLLRREVPAAEVIVSNEDEDPFEIWDVDHMPGPET